MRLLILFPVLNNAADKESDADDQREDGENQQRRADIRERVGKQICAPASRAAHKNRRGQVSGAHKERGNQAKNTIHRYFGYGVPDIERVKECTKEQVTLIGYGELKQGSAYVYSLPIPIEFHEHKYFRRLVLTLSYFSPIWPSSLKYREHMVWMTIDNGNKLIGSRKEYDFHAVTRGTVQHEIFENDSIEPWDTDSSIEIKVNCKEDASKNHPEMLIPYALFATFEMAPEYGIDVYQKIVDKVRIKTAVLTRAD